MKIDFWKLFVSAFHKASPVATVTVSVPNSAPVVVATPSFSHNEAHALFNGHFYAPVVSWLHARALDWVRANGKNLKEQARAYIMGLLPVAIKDLCQFLPPFAQTFAPALIPWAVGVADHQIDHILDWAEAEILGDSDEQPEETAEPAPVGKTLAEVIGAYPSAPLPKDEPYKSLATVVNEAPEPETPLNAELGQMADATQTASKDELARTLAEDGQDAAAEKVEDESAKTDAASTEQTQ